MFVRYRSLFVTHKKVTFVYIGLASQVKDQGSVQTFPQKSHFVKFKLFDIQMSRIECF
jgi:hypothetical protein